MDWCHWCALNAIHSTPEYGNSLSIDPAPHRCYWGPQGTLHTGRMEDRTDHSETGKRKFHSHVMCVCVCDVCVSVCVCVHVSLTCTVGAVTELRTAHFEMGITQPLEEIIEAFVSPVCVCVCVCACVYVGGCT